MRLVFKILALPFVLITGILYLVCKFLVVSSGAVLGILSGNHFSGVTGPVLYCRSVGGAFVAGDRISD